MTLGVIGGTLGVIGGTLVGLDGPPDTHIYSEVVLADTPDLYWQFQETADGSSVADSSGNGRSGSKQGSGGSLASAVPLINDDEYSWLRGTGDAYWASNGNANDTGLDVGTGDFAYEMWVKLSNGTGSYVELFSRDSAATGNGIAVYLNQGDGVYRIWLGGSVVNGSQRISDDSVHHLVITRTGGTMRAFIDGKVDATMASTASIDPTQRALRLGVVNGTYSRPTGNIAQFAFYKHALTADRIWEHYIAGKGPVAAQYAYVEVTFVGARPDTAEGYAYSELYPINTPPAAGAQYAYTEV